MMKHELFIAVVSLLIGMFIGLTIALFALEAGCELSGKETINLSRRGESNVILEFNLPSKP